MGLRDRVVERDAPLCQMQCACQGLERRIAPPTAEGDCHRECQGTIGSTITGIEFDRVQVGTLRLLVGRHGAELRYRLPLQERIVGPQIIGASLG